MKKSREKEMWSRNDGDEAGKSDSEIQTEQTRDPESPKP